MTVRSTAGGTSALLGRGVRLGASSIIVFRERGEEGWFEGEYRLGSQRIASGWAFDAVTDKRSGNELNQTFHRSS